MLSGWVDMATAFSRYLATLLDLTTLPYTIILPMDVVVLVIALPFEHPLQVGKDGVGTASLPSPVSRVMPDNDDHAIILIQYHRYLMFQGLDSALDSRLPRYACT